MARENVHKVIPAVFIVMQREDGKVLLLKRKNTGWRDGWWCLPAGHGEKGESFLHGAIREAEEEVGAIIQPEDMKFSHVHESPAEEADEERVNFFFVCKKWQGEPTNAEPHKASEIGWFDPNDLPEKTIEHFKSSIEHSFNRVYYSNHGFED